MVTFMKHFLLTLLVVLGIIASFLFLEETSVEDSNISTTLLVRNLDTPWAIDFLPDGRVIFTERGGRISIYDGNVSVVGELDVAETSEAGLLGIAVDPDFVNHAYVYVYYTYEKEGIALNRVSRFLLNTTLTGEHILLDEIPSAKYHDGGRIKFGPDGMLHITTGDATDPSSSQNLTTLAGKILRMNKDGTIPSDNPFGNYVYTYGHRNPQGLAWHENQLYSSEHGPTKNDEINLIMKGKNYGWPQTCVDTGEYEQPLRCYTEFTLAPSGMDFLGDNLYVGGLRGTQLRRLTFFENGSVAKEEEVISDLGRIREVRAYMGDLYIATSNRDGRGIPGLRDDIIMKVSFR